MIAEPTIQDLITAGAQAVRACDKNADFVRGSDYEALIGPSAILWTRQAARDTDVFDAVNFHTADGDNLTELVQLRFGKDRVRDTRGSGTLTIRRSAPGVAETIWAGTRISVLGDTTKLYRTTEDVEAATTDVILRLPIEALQIGPGAAFMTTNPGQLRVEDSLKDTTWFAAEIEYGDGTLFEAADEFQTRVRQERLDERVGQTKRLIQTCEDVGAVHVALYRCDYAGDQYDHGLNVCYVGDLGYRGTPELVKACTLALRKTRVMGDNLQVLPMASATLVVEADVVLTKSPALVDLTRLRNLHISGIRQYLNGPGGRFTYSLDGIRGAIARNTQEVKRVNLVLPSADASIVVGSNKNFPAVLNRYVAGQITLRYHGP